MRIIVSIATSLALIGLIVPAAGQQKAVKACQEEWRANKADNQAKGITEKAYVAQCRGGSSAAQPASTPAATPSAPAPGAAAQKTAKACREEWRANKTAYEAAKVTERVYVDKCRAGEVVALPSAPTAAPPPPPPTSTTAAPPPPPPPSRSATAPTSTRSPSTVGTTGTNQFATEAQAKGRCYSDTVVWVNLNTRIYHFAGHRDYGNTKSGTYMCERDATTQGMRAAKNEKHP